jgi:hypothetical protein
MGAGESAHSKEDTDRLVACTTPAMNRLLFAMLACCSCAIAFSPGLKPSPAPEKFQDIENSPSGENQKAESQSMGTPPTFGVSLVAGGKKVDAGALPPPPIPIVILPVN